MIFCGDAAQRWEPATTPSRVALDYRPRAGKAQLRDGLTRTEGCDCRPYGARGSTGAMDPRAAGIGRGFASAFSRLRLGCAAGQRPCLGARTQAFSASACSISRTSPSMADPARSARAAVVTYAFATEACLDTRRAQLREDASPRQRLRPSQISAPPVPPARSPPPSACGRRSPTSPSASPPTRPRRHLIGAQAQPLGRAFTNVA